MGVHHRNRIEKVSNRQTVKLYYSDTFELPLPENHRFPMAKYRLLRERLAVRANRESYELLLPPAALDQQLLLVHTPEYLEKIKSGQLSNLEIRRIGFPWSLEMVERSRRSTGASIAAGRTALQEAVAANLAGGTHHSFSHSGQGFCVFNDVCVAARILQQERLVENVLIVDCDVHQGNGTAAICHNDPTIFSFSLHCDKNYPFRKQIGDLDITVPPNTGDAEYLRQLELALRQIEIAFQPDLVFYLAGADPFIHDRLGLLSLTKEGLRRRDQLVLSFFHDRDVPIAIAMAGGYAPVLSDIVDIHETTIVIANQICHGIKPS